MEDGLQDLCYMPLHMGDGLTLSHIHKTLVVCTDQTQKKSWDGAKPSTSPTHLVTTLKCAAQLWLLRVSVCCSTLAFESESFCSAPLTPCDTVHFWPVLKYISLNTSKWWKLNR